jgi:hypothetical protein
MSRNDWERGTLKIPAAAWKPLRDGLAAAHNKRQARLFELALKLHGLVTEWKKTCGRGKFDVNHAIAELALQRAHQPLFDELERFNGEWEVRRSLQARDEHQRADPKTLHKPKKKDFPLAVATKETSYRQGEASVHLNAAARELTWFSGENNRAVERARESNLGVTLFQALHRITWTRGSGGEFVGNDEYNQDNRHEGGGANYVTQRFGLETAADKRHKAIGLRGYARARYR